MWLVPCLPARLGRPKKNGDWSGMKRISRLWTNSTRLARILLVLLLALYQGCGSGGGGGGGGGAPPAPVAAGSVEIALADSPSSSFQQIVLNVVSVRFNPSTNLK